MRCAVILAVLGLLWAPVGAGAACQWEFVCDAVGNCEQVAVCDSAVDIAPVRPPRVDPIVGPSIEPIETPRIPPVGTSDCTQVRRLNPATGAFEWSEVCY